MWACTRRFLDHQAPPGSRPDQHGAIAGFVAIAHRNRDKSRCQPRRWGVQAACGERARRQGKARRQAAEHQIGAGLIVMEFKLEGQDHAAAKLRGPIALLRSGRNWQHVLVDWPCGMSSPSGGSGLDAETLQRLVARHRRGDWGEVDARDARDNVRGRLPPARRYAASTPSPKTCQVWVSPQPRHRQPCTPPC